MITRLLWSFWWELENFSRGGFEKPSILFKMREQIEIQDQSAYRRRPA